MITAILTGLGTLAVIFTTMVIRARPIRVKHYVRNLAYDEEYEFYRGLQWPPEDVQ